MATLHILVGENEAWPIFERCAKRKTPIEWVVPKTAQPGDHAYFVFNRSQVLGSGIIADEPWRDQFGRKVAYRAHVERLRQFLKPLELEDLGRRIPEWKWPTYPRSLNTPTIEIARQVDKWVGNHIMTSGLLGGAQPSPRSKVTAKIAGSTQGELPRDRDPKRTKAQIDAIVDEQTGGFRLSAESRKFLQTHVVSERKAANRKVILDLRARAGRLACDACGLDLGKLFGPEFALVLELHHRVPLRRGAQMPKGTEAFALLCPTCHRVVHYRREEPMDVEVLRNRLLR